VEQPTEQLTEQPTKSLDRWRFELKKYGKKHWHIFYASLLSVPISNNGRFYKALTMYGEWPLFEAIVATSNATIKGDPLSYVLAVAHAKWKEAQEIADKQAAVEEDFEQAVLQNKEINDELQEKLRRAREGK
jgi:hypothetical protein